MKITVYDRIVNAYDDRNVQFDAQRIQLILEGLGSLDQFATEYLVFAEDTFPQDILALIAEDGMNVLPVTVVDEKVFQKGQHLSNEDFMELTGITFEITDEEECDHDHDHDHDHAGGCCCGHHH